LLKCLSISRLPIHPLTHLGVKKCLIKGKITIT
jgi:hypothetical protein